MTTALLPIYERDLTLVKGKGSRLWDKDGREWLDFAAGIAVNGFGYGDKAIVSAVKKQAERLMHTSNLFHTEPASALAERLVRLAFPSKVFFTNSGTEAFEGAMKFARRIGKEQGRTEYVAFESAFHGRTMGALSLTWTAKYREPFEPLVPGVRFVPRGDLAALREAVSQKTAAVFIEPVQGEGGIRPATPEFLKGLEAICREKGALVVFDEIQCGLGHRGEVVARDEADPRHQRLERLAVLRRPGDRERAHRAAVERVLEDDVLDSRLFLPDPAGELHRPFPRLRPRVGEEDLRGEGEPHEALGEGARGLVVVQVAHVHERRGLLLDRGHDLAVAVAEPVHRDPRGEVEPLAPLGVPEARALALHEGDVAVVDGKKCGGHSSPSGPRAFVGVLPEGTSPSESARPGLLGCTMRVPGNSPRSRATPAITTSGIPAAEASRATRTLSAMPPAIVPSSIRRRTSSGVSDSAGLPSTRTPSTSER